MDDLQLILIYVHGEAYGAMVIIRENERRDPSSNSGRGYSRSTYGQVVG